MSGKSEFKPDTKRISALFYTLDTQKDGFIDYKELYAYLKKTGQKFTKGEVKSLIKKGDVGKDGMLDYKEFMEFMVGHEHKMWEHFVMLDRDGSGHVSYSELEIYCRGQGLNIPEKRIKEIISELDTDGNLLISWDEFREFNQFRTDFKLSGKHYYGDPYADGIVHLPERKKDFGHGKKLICGGIAGVISRTATAPLDRIKVLLQVQGNQKVMGASQDLGATQLFREMYKQGVRTMWRGNGISCIKIFPENAFRFLIFEYLCSKKSFALSKYDMVNKLISGGITGITIQSVMYPVELTKTRVMTAQNSLGLAGTIKEIAGENGKRFGITNFYKGIAPAVVGVIPFAALQLGLSKKGTELYREWNNVGNPGFWPLLSISSAATLFAMGFTYPLRLMTCQMQAYKGPASGRPTVGPLFTKIVKNEGPRGFYRGFAANAMKAVPASALGWAVFTKTQTLYEKYLE